MVDIVGVAGFDAESTLTHAEALDQLALWRGGNSMLDNVQGITSAAMGGAANFEESLQARLALVGPVSNDDWVRMGTRYIEHLDPAAHAAIQACRDQRLKPVIISGGFRQALLPLAEHLGISPEDLYALDYDELTNAARPSALLANNGKAVVFNSIVEQAHSTRAARYTARRVRHVMTGDGMTDARVKQARPEDTAFIAVGNRRNVLALGDEQLPSLEGFPEALEKVLSR